MAAPDNATGEDRKFVGYFEHFPRVAGAIVLIIGALVLVGWAMNIPVLRDTGTGSKMMPSTAVCFMLSGLAVFLEGGRNAARWAIISARILAIVVLLIAIMTIAEHALGQNLGLDLLLFRDQVIAASPGLPGRMAINTAAAFICIAISILVLPRDRRVNGVASQVASFGAVVLAFIALIGYAFGVRDFYSMQPIVGMALMSAIAFLILGL